MPSRWDAATCGWRRRVFHCPPPTPTPRYSQTFCTTDLYIPLPTSLEMRKDQRRTGATETPFHTTVVSSRTRWLNSGQHRGTITACGAFRATPSQ